MIKLTSSPDAEPFVPAKGLNTTKIEELERKEAGPDIIPDTFREGDDAFTGLNMISPQLPPRGCGDCWRVTALKYFLS